MDGRRNNNARAKNFRGETGPNVQGDRIVLHVTSGCHLEYCFAPLASTKDAQPSRYAIEGCRVYWIFIASKLQWMRMFSVSNDRLDVRIHPS